MVWLGLSRCHLHPLAAPSDRGRSPGKAEQISNDVAPDTQLDAVLGYLAAPPGLGPDTTDTAGAATSFSSATFGCVVNPFTPRCPVVVCDDGAVKAEQHISSAVEAPVFNGTVKAEQISNAVDAPVIHGTDKAKLQISCAVEAPASDDDEELVPFDGDNPYIGAPVMMYVKGVRYTGHVVEANVGVRSRSCFYLIRYHDGELQDVTEEELKRVILPTWK